MTMKKLLKRFVRGGCALVLATAMSGLAPEGASAQISVIVSAGSSQTADQGQVARMFSGEVTAWSDGTRVQLVDQSGTDLGAQFYSAVLQRSASQVRKALTALLLSGQIPKPEQVGSDAEVKAAVARMSGSIGYIASSSLDASVKELIRIPGS